MVKCAVKSCKNYSCKKGLKDVKYFTFPKEKKLLYEWVKNCGHERKFKVNSARICSDHFTEADWKMKDILLNTPRKKRRLKMEAVPSQNLKLIPSNRDLEEKCTIDPEMVEEYLDFYEEKFEHTEEKYTSEDNIEEKNTPQGSMKIPTVKCEISNYNYISKESQTEADFDCGRELEILQLRQELKKSRREANIFKTKWQESESFNLSVSKMLTEGQIRRLKNPDKALKWTSDDILYALSLYDAGRHAYKLLRRTNFPLPEASTLRRWEAKFRLAKTQSTQQHNAAQLTSKAKLNHQMQYA